jgi:hypothetical protein
MARRRLELRAAAAALGISVDAARKRVLRGSLESEKAPDGRVYVWLDEDQDTGADSGTPRSDTERLISTLQEQLSLEREAHAEARRLLAAALERIPALEPPGVPEPSRGDSEDTEPRSGTEGPQEGAQRPWWQFWR